MKRAIIFILFILLAKSQFIDKQFPYECFFTNGPIVYLEYTCKIDGNPQRSTCLNPLYFHQSGVEVLTYLCAKQLNSLTLYPDVFSVFKNVRVLDTSYLGINNITFVRSDLISENQISRWRSAHNKLTQIPNSILDWMPKIDDVNFSFNKIIYFSFKSLTKASDISILNCSHNEILNINSAALSKLSKLKILDLSFNKIAWIDEAAFKSNLNLKVLNLENNPFKFSSKLISSLRDLEILDLSNTQNGKDNYGSFENNPKIKKLNLNGIPLKRFNFNIFSRQTKLVDVHLPSNSIEELDISCVDSICHFKQFYKDDFFKNIRNFKASGNRDQNYSNLLENIGQNVDTLDLSQNSIGTLKNKMLERFSNLKHLNLSHSNISKIESDAFLRQSNLVTLDLSKNELKNIDSVTFAFHWKLEHLKLAGNHLTEINKVVPTILQKLKLLEILENNFNPLYLEGLLEQWKYYGVKIDVNINASITTQLPTMKTRTTNTSIRENRSFQISATTSDAILSTLVQNNELLIKSSVLSPATNGYSSSQLVYIITGVAFIIIGIIVVIFIVSCRREPVKTTSVGLSTVSTNVTTLVDEPPYEEIRDPMPSAYAIGTLHHMPHYENVPAHTTALDHYENYNASLQSNDYATVYHHYATISKPKSKRY